MTKTEFIRKVKETHSEYSTALEGLSQAELMKPKTCGDWSVKDVIAHITWYECQMVNVIANRCLTGSPWWNLPLQERNAAIFELNMNRSAREIVEEAQAIFRELTTQLDTLTEEDLNTAGNFNDMPTEWKPWEVIASNTFEHYPEHVRDIQAAFLRRKNNG